LKTIFLILIFGMIFVSGCAKEKITLTVENLNDKQFTEGIYYEYKYSDEELKGLKDINVDLILNNLIQNNIKITDVWYKSYAASCCPPDTNRCMTAIVNPVFIIKLDEETELNNFIKINEPKIGWCAYAIAHYKIK